MPSLLLKHIYCGSMQGTVLYTAVWARGRSLHRGSSAEKGCDLCKRRCNTVFSGLDLCNTLWPYAVSERGCQSCQSTTIHLSHKAIECDSKHSSWAKPVLKNYLNASRWKADRLFQMGTVRPVPVLICLRLGYKVTQDNKKTNHIKIIPLYRITKFLILISYSGRFIQPAWNLTSSLHRLSLVCIGTWWCAYHIQEVNFFGHLPQKTTTLSSASEE